MEYPYLNQPTFDGQCALPGMDASLPNCNIPCSYGDSSPFAQMGQSYRYNGVRSFPTVSNPGLPTGASCGVVARPRDHPQAPVFPPGKSAQFVWFFFPRLFIFFMQHHLFLWVTCQPSYVRNAMPRHIHNLIILPIKIIQNFFLNLVILTPTTYWRCCQVNENWTQVCFIFHSERALLRDEQFDNTDKK